MKKLPIVAAVAEAAAGVTLLTVPSLVGQSLFGAGLDGIAVIIARVAGIALIALGVACLGTPLVGMLTYTALAALYLLYLGMRSEWVGSLLWPAIVLHGILTFLLARMWFDRNFDRNKDSGVSL